MPVAWQLYLPRNGPTIRAAREGRRARARKFATKTADRAAADRTPAGPRAPRHCVLADAGYGVDTAFRQRLSDLGLPYVVGVTSAVVVWPPGIEPLPPKPYSGRGRPPVMPRRTRSSTAGERQGPGAFTASRRLRDDHLARGYERHAQRALRRRAGASCRRQSAGAPAPRAVAAHRVARRARRATEVLPVHPARGQLHWRTGLEAHMRWRIERDYQDLKQDLGLGHYEGRGWRGFHHHAASASPPMASCSLNDWQRGQRQRQKNFADRQAPALPADYIPRGSPARTAPRPRFDHHDSSSTQVAC